MILKCIPFDLCKLCQSCMSMSAFVVGCQTLELSCRVDNFKKNYFALVCSMTLLIQYLRFSSILLLQQVSQFSKFKDMPCQNAL